MAMDDKCVVFLQAGEPEIVECGAEAMLRIPILMDGKEIGEYIIASEELDG